jgi:hypothetical protein
MWPVLGNAQTTVKEYKGEVIDSDSRKELELVNITVKNTNIATVTNSEGQFVIKVPETNLDGLLVVSYLGYSTRELPIAELKSVGNTIRLSPLVTQLSEVNLSAYKDAKLLVKKVFEQKVKNNHDNTILMTAFYRETIKRRRRNVSLTEAVVNLQKQPYNSANRDAMELRKARKTTDYKRLDTLSLKLKGGPFSNIYLDIMKYPEYIFSEETIDDYDYSFAESTNINGRPVYVVDFRVKENRLDVGYYGKLFIDVQSVALVSADYSLDLSNKKRTKNLLVEKKPASFVAYPTMANYHVDYKETDGVWYYSYSSVDLSFKINKKRQLFNAVYSLSSEMAVTDWQPVEGRSVLGTKNRLRPSMIISDEISGFSDPDFWGTYNLIEPDKSIESAIEKIRKQLERSVEEASAP